MFDRNSNEPQGIHYLKRCQVSKALPHLSGSFSLGRSQLKCDTHRKTLVLCLRVHTFSFTHLAKFTSACTCFFPLVLTTLWILWRQCPKMVGGLGIPHLPLHTHQAFLHPVLQLRSWPSLPASEGSLDLWLLARSAYGGVQAFEEGDLFSFLCPFPGSS